MLVACQSLLESAVVHVAVHCVHVHTVLCYKLALDLWAL